jgi:hypothetical protein
VLFRIYSAVAAWNLLKGRFRDNAQGAAKVIVDLVAPCWSTQLSAELFAVPFATSITDLPKRSYRPGPVFSLSKSASSALSGFNFVP